MSWNTAPTMTDKPTPGGLRNPPGGRPPLPESERKVKLSITISPEVRDWLKAKRKRPNEPISQVIDRQLNSQRNNEMLDDLFGKP